MARETLCAAVVTPTAPAKLSEVPLTMTRPAFPVPFNATLCGEPITKSLKSNVALRAPVALGVKITDTVQLAEAANEDPQFVEI